MRTAWRTHSALITGSMPGIAASTSETCEFGSPPNAVEAPENSLACEVTWACTSRPMTTSQSPVAPLMSLFDLPSVALAFIALVLSPSHCARALMRQERSIARPRGVS